MHPNKFPVDFATTAQGKAVLARQQSAHRAVNASVADKLSCRRKFI
jgi:hypothetical protein